MPALIFNCFIKPKISLSTFFQFKLVLISYGLQCNTHFVLSTLYFLSFFNSLATTLATALCACLCVGRGKLHEPFLEILGISEKIYIGISLKLYPTTDVIISLTGKFHMLFYLFSLSHINLLFNKCY